MTIKFSRKLTRPLAATFLFGLVATPAFSFGILDLDVNHDGSISSAEAQQVIESQFDHMNANRDGHLTKTEYTDARLAELGRLDANHDGQITRSELRETFRAAFRR
ncbi:MAG: hypothetical protein WA138_00025 [Parvibaculum sp.]